MQVESCYKYIVQISKRRQQYIYFLLGKHLEGNSVKISALKVTFPIFLLVIKRKAVKFHPSYCSYFVFVFQSFQVSLMLQIVFIKKERIMGSKQLHVALNKMCILFFYTTFPNCWHVAVSRVYWEQVFFFLWHYYSFTFQCYKTFARHIEHLLKLYSNLLPRDSCPFRIEAVMRKSLLQAGEFCTRFF